MTAHVFICFILTYPSERTINFSFVEEAWERDLAGNADPIRLLNPIASQMGVMRSSLLGSLLQVLRFNVDRKADRVRVFELGRVFLRDASVAATDSTVRGVHQPMRVAGLAWGDVDGLQWGRKATGVDFYDVKGDVESLLAPAGAQFSAGQHPALHPGRCARVSLQGRDIGVVGERVGEVEVKGRRARVVIYTVTGRAGEATNVGPDVPPVSRE